MWQINWISLISFVKFLDNATIFSWIQMFILSCYIVYALQYFTIRHWCYKYNKRTLLLSISALLAYHVCYQHISCFTVMLLSGPHFIHMVIVAIDLLDLAVLWRPLIPLPTFSVYRLSFSIFKLHLTNSQHGFWYITAFYDDAIIWASSFPFWSR